MQREEAEKIIRKVEEVPTIPAMITRILEVVDDGGTSAKDLEKVVSLDQSIAAKVLRISNSAYYGFSREIATLHRAIVILGFQTVKALALGSSIFETFFRPGEDSYFDRTAYWHHSIASSRCAMAIARRLKGVEPDEVFLAGLIHDIGMLVMDHVLHEEYSRVLEKAIKEGGPLDMLERDAWGFDHGDVGAWLGEQWRFPPPLLEAIRFHHRLSKSSGHWKVFVAGVYLSDFCSHQAGLGVANTRHSVVEEEALKTTRITEDDLTVLIDQVRDEKDEIEAFFSAMSV